MISFTPYKKLIESIPIEDQMAIAKWKTWHSKTKNITKLKLQKPDDKSDNIFITRGNLINRNCAITNGILQVLIWGYPSGGRGDNIKKCIRNIDLISTALRKLKNSKNIDIKQFKDFVASCDSIPGLGISTWSKLLYFNGINIIEYKCNIYDAVVKNALTKLSIDLADYADPTIKPKEIREYISYLKFLSIHAGEIGLRTDQLEYFLFLFGNKFQLSINHQ